MPQKVDSLIQGSNSIDTYFNEKLSTASCETEYRDYQSAYLSAWEAEYTKIYDLLMSKCIYEEDASLFIAYNEEIENNYKTLEPALLAVMLDNFDLQESSEKHSWGNGTNDMLKMYQGIVYRNACMIFYPYISDEYEFPSESELEMYSSNLNE